MKKANIEAALFLDITPEGFIQMGLNTTTAHRGAKVVLAAGRNLLFERAIDVSPEAPFFQEIKLPPDASKKNLRLSLLSPSGDKLISYVPVKPKGDPMPEPVMPPKAPKEIDTVDELYHTGLRLEQFHNPSLKPYPYYKEALERDPDNYAVNTALGILYCKQGMYVRAQHKYKEAFEAFYRATKGARLGELLATIIWRNFPV